MANNKEKGGTTPPEEKVETTPEKKKDSCLQEFTIQGCAIKHNGKTYTVGEKITLTEAEYKRLEKAIKGGK
jgi:hypothetical protein